MTKIIFTADFGANDARNPLGGLDEPDKEELNTHLVIAIRQWIAFRNLGDPSQSFETSLDIQ